MTKYITAILTAVTLFGTATQASAENSNWSKMMDANIMNFDFVAPIVADDTVPPKQGGLIFFNMDESEFQGWGPAGNKITLGSTSGAGSTTSTEWTAYTPIFGAGFGTTSGISFFWRRVGDSIEVNGRFTGGTIAAALGTISLPTSLTIDTAKIANTSTSDACPLVGYYQADSANQGGAIVAAVSSDASVVYYANHQINVSNPSRPTNISTNFSSNLVHSVKFSAPISGWTNSN